MIGPMFSTVYFDLKKQKTNKRKIIANENIKILNTTYLEVKKNFLNNKSSLDLILYSMIKINNQNK